MRLFRQELSVLLRSLREPALWLLLIGMVLLGVGAYRAPLRYTLDVGGAPGGPVYDRPYLEGFNAAPEFDDPDAPSQAFRWAFPGARVVFPGAGRGLYAVRLDVAAGQPRAEPVNLDVAAAGVPVATLPLAPGPRSYHLIVPAAGRDLDLQFDAPPFQAAGDPRLLLFAADALAIRAVAPLLPAPVTLAWLAAVVAGGYALMRRWGVPTWTTSLVGAAAVLLLAALLVFRRFGLVGFAPRLTALLLLVYAGTIVVEPLLRSFARLLGLALSAYEARGAAALVMLAWAIRLAGLWHPQALTSDLGLHAHNLENLATGEVIFTEGLPSEAGGGRAPYPPGQYVMLLPGALLLSSERLVQAGNALADSLVIAANWLLLRVAGAPARTALFSGALYLFALPLLLSLSVGEMANVWAQALVAPLFLGLLCWRLGRLPSAVLLGLLTVSLVAHSGVFLSLLLFLGVYLLHLFARGRGARPSPPVLLAEKAVAGPSSRQTEWNQERAGEGRSVSHPPAALLVLVLLAVAVALLVYYSAFLGAELGGQAGRSAPRGLAGMLRELVATVAWSGPIGPVVAVLGTTGIALTLRRSPELGVLLLACMLSALLSLGSLLVSQQTLRWQTFVFPALAVGGGVLLAALERRGWLGRAAAYLLLTLTLLHGAWRWYQHVATYLH